MNYVVLREGMVVNARDSLTSSMGRSELHAEATLAVKCLRGESRFIWKVSIADDAYCLHYDTARLI